LQKTFFVNYRRLSKAKPKISRTRQAACCLAGQGAHPMKLLLLAIIIGAVVLLSYFGKPVSPQPADQGASPS
jgi:hypothetical protein